MKKLKPARFHIEACVAYVGA